MKKKIIAISAAVALLALLAMSTSLAWFSDNDEVTNVFTVGSVKIEQNELGADGKEFVQEQDLMPIVDVNDPAADENYIAKIVDVESTGENPAYVRTHIAIPTKLVGTLVLDLSDSTKWVEAAAATETEVGGESFTVYSFTYTEELNKGDVTDDLLLGVYVDAKTDLKDNPATEEADLEFCYFDDAKGEYVFTGYVAWKADGTASEKVNVLVATQACQAQGFADAQTALDTVFGTIPTFTAP